MLAAMIAVLVVLFLFLLFMISAVKIAREYERAVVRMSRFCSQTSTRYRLVS